MEPKRGDVDIMVTNTVKKLALQKQTPHKSENWGSHEVMRSDSSFFDLKKKFLSPEECQKEITATLSTNPESSVTPYNSPKNSLDAPETEFGTVDDIVNGTLRKLEKKKNSSKMETEQNLDKEGNTIRSKTSVAESINRFSLSDEQENGLRFNRKSTQIGEYPYSEQPREIILEEKANA